MTVIVIGASPCPYIWVTMGPKHTDRGPQVLLVQRRAADDDAAQAAGGPGRGPRRPRAEHGRGEEGGVRHPVLLHQVDEAAGREAGSRRDDLRRAAGGGRQQVEPAAVGQRGGVQVDAAVGDRVEVAQVGRGHRGEVAVGERRALRPPGRPRGVEQPGRVVVRGAGQGRRRRGEARSRSRSRRPEPSAAGHPHDPDPLRQGAGGGGRLVADDDGGRAAVADDVADLVGVQVPVDRHGDEPAVEGGPERLDQLGAVGHQQHDAVTGPQPEGGEAGREPGRPGPRAPGR